MERIELSSMMKRSIKLRKEKRNQLSNSGSKRFFKTSNTEISGLNKEQPTCALYYITTN